MKTNIILSSASRELFGVKIRQQTKSYFLCLSDLQHAYAIARETHGWSDKRLNDIFSSESNMERVYYLLKKSEIIRTDFTAFMEAAKEKGLTKLLKSIGLFTTKGKGDSRVTYCDPHIWVLVAMEMNPMVYAEVVSWLTDRLILNRIDSGDMYKDLSKAASKFLDVDYKVLAKAMNHIVFGRHENEIRNTGTEEQLKELHKLESNLCFLIDTGLIGSFSELRDQLVKLWQAKQLI